MNDKTRPWWSFGLAAATVFMVSLDATAVVAAFPTLRAHFAESSSAGLSWTINAYTILFAALLVPLGRIVDRAGHRRCFLASVAGFTLASAACAVAPTSAWLILGRALQGISAAMLSPASLALVLAAFPAEHRSRSVGLLSAVGALAAAIGPALGSMLIDLFSWRMIFLINLPIGLIACLLTWRKLLPDVASSIVQRFDGLGTLLLVLSVGLLAAGLAEAGEVGVTSAAVLGPLLTGAALLVGLVRWCSERPDAALDLRLFADSNYHWASIGTLLLGASFGLMFLAFYLFFVGVWHYSQSSAGLAATPGPMCATLVAVSASPWLRHWGFARPTLLGGLLFAASNVWLVLRLGPEPAYLSTWLPGQLVGGSGIGLMLISLTGAATARLRNDQLGTGSAANNALRQLGSSLGVALAVAIAGHRFATIEAFRWVYGCLLACGLGIAMISAKLRSP